MDRIRGEVVDGFGEDDDLGARLSEEGFELSLGHIARLEGPRRRGRGAMRRVVLDRVVRSELIESLVRFAA